MTATTTHQLVHAADAPGRPWWRSAVIYQVYPRSFADSDGDGIGDLPGITSRLEHLVDLGVDALWLSPFYLSPQADAGYDVADYRTVDPVFGTLADADALLHKASRLGLRVIIDLVPNHTSDEHAWFQAALQSPPGSPERDLYLFRDGLGEHGERPPNDWKSVFGGTAWQRVIEPDGSPGQWYLHLFDVKQPDLNWQNAKVRAEFESILRFWLDRGVAGFRIDVAHGLIKAPGLPSYGAHHELLHGKEEDRPRPPYWDQEGVHDIYRAWHRIVEEYEGDRVLVAEAWVEPAQRLARYVRPDELHQSFNFPYLLAPWSAAALREVVTESLQATDEVGAPTTWVLSNHDVLRHATRFGFAPGTALPNGIGADDPQPDVELGLRRARAATLLMLALPGAAYVYQGEELGLPEHTTMPDGVRQDPTWLRSGHQHRGRDGCRVPIPWQGNAPSYGFGPGPLTWLPQPASWRHYALDAQQGVPGSTFETYRAALRLRRAHGLGTGSLAWVAGPVDGQVDGQVDGPVDGQVDGWGPDVVALANGEVVVLANLGSEPIPLPEGAVVLLASQLLTEVDGVVNVPPDVTVWARLPA